MSVNNIFFSENSYKNSKKSWTFWVIWLKLIAKSASGYSMKAYCNSHIQAPKLHIQKVKECLKYGRKNKQTNKTVTTTQNKTKWKRCRLKNPEKLIEAVLLGTWIGAHICAPSSHFVKRILEGGYAGSDALHPRAFTSWAVNNKKLSLQSVQRLKL